jgi:hypothetical protein
MLYFLGRKAPAALASPRRVGGRVTAAVLALTFCFLPSARLLGQATQQISVDSIGNPAPAEPNAAFTPGAVVPVTVQDICTPGYTRKVRNVPVQVKRAVYRRYGIWHHRAGEYEVDHLISLELGGSNSARNLWPQSRWTTPWNAYSKDTLENELHREVCDGRLPLATAQHDIAVDWIAAYRKYVERARRTRK